MHTTNLSRPKVSFTELRVVVALGKRKEGLNREGASWKSGHLDEMRP
jgi:hypothetical protein